MTKITSLKSDLLQLKKSDDWSRGFNWADYSASKSEFTAYKLHITGNPIIQGLLAIAVREGFVELDLIEKAPSNRKPRNEFINIGEILFAFACLLDSEKFLSKNCWIEK